MSQQNDYRCRTLIVVRYLDPDRQLVGLWAAGRIYSETIEVSFSLIPPHILNVMEPEKILHAKANTGASKAKDVVFSEWETE